MNKLTRVLLALVVMTTVNGCLLKKSASGDVSVDDGSNSGGSYSGGVSATPTPNGMYCEGRGGGTGGDTAEQFDSSNGRFFVSSKIAGSFLNSVKLKIKLGTNLSGSTTYSTTMNLKVYTCGSSSSHGSLQQTATATVGLWGAYKTVTFTFSTPVAIPASCGGNPYPAVFEFIGQGQTGYPLTVESEIAGSTCDAKFSIAGSGGNLNLSPRAWSAIIGTTP